MNVKRGDIYYADLSPVVGSEQGGVRPVLIVQNDVGNKYSPTVIAAAITSKINTHNIPTKIFLIAAFIKISFPLLLSSLILTSLLISSYPNPKFYAFYT